MRNRLTVTVAFTVAFAVAFAGPAWANQAPGTPEQPVAEQAPEPVAEQAPEPLSIDERVRVILTAAVDLRTAHDDVMLTESMAAEATDTRNATETARGLAVAAADAAAADLDTALGVHSDAMLAREVALAAFLAATAGP